MKARQRLRGTSILGAVFAVAVLVSVSGCPRPSDFPSVPRDDVGDRAWVRQVVPIVLGRKVKGYTEVKMLADLVAVTDRPTVLRGLMAGTEFNEHWSETLVNTIRIDRESTLTTGSDQSDCYGAPLRAGAPDAALAAHVLANATSMPAPGGAFNMSDVVRSAVVGDNLAGLYRANLFALQHHFPQQQVEQQARDTLGVTFEDVYLNREASPCLACHNSDLSTTGPSSGWNRFYPILGSFEAALYGASTGADPADMHAMFRSDQLGTGAAPWGISGCGTFQATLATSSGANPYFTGPLAMGATVTTLADLFKQGYEGLAAHGLSRSVPSAVQAACTTCQTSCSGGTPLDPDSVVNGTFVRDLLSAHMAGTDCGTCHGGTDSLWFYDPMPPAGDHWYSHLINIPSADVAGEMRVAPGDAADSALPKKLRGTAPPRMPLGGTPLAEADIEKVEAWINALPPSAAACTNCSTLDCDPTHIDHPTEAFAYLAAARIVNVVWQEAMGYPLTINNYFPRNAGQRGALWNLTESTFIPSGWSLRELLVRILTSDMFNRRPPDTQGTPGSPYQEPPIFDPWVIPDPRIPPANQPGWNPAAHPDLYGNAMTDGVYRYSAYNLLRSVQKAMDWPAPLRFPPPALLAPYPWQLQRDIGQYVTSANPGFRVTNFPALLSWEHELGTCANHRTDQGQDWIDRLAAAAAGFTPPASDPTPLTLRDLIVVEQDWLLGDGSIPVSAPPPLTQTEEQALTTIVGSLASTVPSLPPADVTSKMRAVCGILLETPQFLLAGIVPDGPGATTRLRVCNAAPCSYQEMCQDITSRIPLPSAGSLWACGADSVTILQPVQPPKVYPQQAFCPWCPVISVNPQGCFDPGARACSVTPPACDARCNRIDCCGGPVARFDQKGTVLLYSDDAATVKQADGVRVRRAGTEKVETLASGSRLSYGDVFELSPQSKLVLTVVVDKVSRDLTYTGVPGTASAPRYVLVTGPKALQATERRRNPPPLTKGELDWLRTKGGLRSPNGTTPIKITPQMRAPGAAEKDWQTRLQRFKQKP
jgi:hypothetical protein